MIAIHLLRHAHAGDAERWAGDDAERPLTEKGRRQSERLGRLLETYDDAPDVFITSPKVRSAQTADIVAAALGLPVVVDARLAGPLDSDVLRAILADHPEAKRPCVVGHDPDFSRLLGDLIGLPELPMRKGALPRVDVASADALQDGGTLRYLVPPELLPAK